MKKFICLAALFASSALFAKPLQFGMSARELSFEDYCNGNVCIERLFYRGSQVMAERRGGFDQSVKDQLVELKKAGKNVILTVDGDDGSQTISLQAD